LLPEHLIGVSLSLSLNQLQFLVPFYRSLAIWRASPDDARITNRRVKFALGDNLIYGSYCDVSRGVCVKGTLAQS
jgi:hypothetical protein